ncbi:MAG: GDP-mannose 4,6-dehydratase [Proteobacteria bacterium]|nr:GDP-mannose 4,6-dehydratase [Pseudomonadota bacterium]
MNVLVTGGAGFIGSHLIERLLEFPDRVICLDDFNDYYPPGLKRENLSALLSHPGFRLIEGDIRDQALMEKTFSDLRPEAVIHLAARAGVRPSIQAPLLYEDVNVRGTAILLDLARRFACGRFVFASSSSVYGDGAKVPFAESDPTNRPVSPYAATKKAGELLCYTYHHLFGLNITALRFFTAYGPRQRPDMAIHRFVRQISAEEPLTMFGDGSSRRDYTYIDDIVAGTLAAYQRCQGFHIYNLGESQTIDLKSLIELISGAMRKKPRVEMMPDQPGDVPITYADISLARQELDYHPRTGIEEGVSRFVRWYLDREARRS